MKNWLSFLTVFTVLFFSVGYAQEEADDANEAAEAATEADFGLNSSGSEHHHHRTNPFETPLNVYKLLLTVGMDEALPTPPVVVGLQGFRDILNWNDQTIETFRQSAISYFNTRFGVDFSGGFYDPNTGITAISYAILIPVTFSGDYRVLASNNKKIPATPVRFPPYVRALEFVCIFNSTATGHFYTGTYANAGPVPINPTDTLDFGVYRIFVSNIFGKTRTYDFYTRVYFPNTAQPINIYPARVAEAFQLYSPDFGPGAGFLNVAVPSTADANGLYPTFIRGTFSFPGSFVLPDLNGYTQSPI